MERFIVRLDVSNAAFEGNNAPHEVARILRDIAARLESGTFGANEPITLRDVNGNWCGTAGMESV